ncbi:hydrolase [Microtetraspora sp. NBRC 13810]|uniref:CocE/NonD family hydrolase n=1 Tax=Microtetraspora sp. NBRC 13810 TaxID=3030990 RepID=UPI0024A303A7|nr:CocE/NonD family hydrolase [Microtetraspora sp. NBRC 13810]GLW11511.1 hydrolase [Microtetraspora sp. NBRC 13810]
MFLVAGDGAILAADYCLPEGPGPFPCVLIRTPYDRRSHAAELRAWARRGFAAVAQDVRGRHGSGGRWHPYLNEAEDGATTVRVLRRQPWSDGTIVACGASYAAHCALATALQDDPAVRPDAVIAAVPALGLAETAREPSGAERLLARAGWWAAHGDRADSDPSALRRALAADPGLLDHLPLLDLPRRLGRPMPSWERLWAAERSGDPAGTPGTGPGAVGRAGSGAIPLLAIGGSHDPFVPDTVSLWRAWGRHGLGAARLLLGPWGHALTASPGPGAGEGHRLALGSLYARFAQAALNGTLTGRRGAVALEGTGQWVAAQEMERLPKPVRMDGEGTGLRVLRGTEFVADPERPVRSDRLDVPADGRPDRFVALSEPLPDPLDLAGDAEARILATADTPSADWAVRLVVLTSRDTAEPLATGVARTRAPAGAHVVISVPLGPMFRRLPAGVRLRLEIAGHHFPAHARNPHTGHDPLRATFLRASRRTVVPDASHLSLPALDRTVALRPVDPAEEITR